MNVPKTFKQWLSKAKITLQPTPSSSSIQLTLSKTKAHQIVLESEKKSIYTVVEESTISNKTEKEEIRIKLEDYERIKSIKKKEIVTQTE